MYNLYVKELKQLFFSPLAWVMMAVSQAILCYLFLIHLQDFIALQPQLKLLDRPPGVTQYLLPRLFIPAATIYLLLVPLLTMRVISSEVKQQTIFLLFSAPLSNTAIIMAKYLSIITLVLLMLSVNSLMLLSLYWSVAIDLVSFIWAFAGTFLFIAACVSAGLFFSTTNKHPLTAGFYTFGFLFLLWIFGLSPATQNQNGNVLQYIAITPHLNSFTNGLFSLQDFVYYLLLIALFIVMSIYKLAVSRG